MTPIKDYHDKLSAYQFPDDRPLSWKEQIYLTLCALLLGVIWFFIILVFFILPE